MSRRPSLRFWPEALKGHEQRLLRLTIILVILSIILALISAFWVNRPGSISEKAILSNLSRARESIQHDFSRFLDRLQKRQAQFAAQALPSDPGARFEFFKHKNLNPDLEGVASFDEKLNPEVWYGSVANLKSLLANQEKFLADLLAGSFVIQDKASTYLVSLKAAGKNSYLAIFELLAFEPQFESSYLRQYLRLKSLKKTGADIDFWEYYHETEALDRLFERNQDTYLSQQREERESRTLYFPLRNEKGKIVATVTLNSYRLEGQRLNPDQLIKILAIILAILALISLLFWLGQDRTRSFWTSKPVDWLLAIIGLIAIRYLLLLLTALKPFIYWPIFSPQEVGFKTLGNLTSSPGDIFLTSLLIFFLGVASLKNLKNLARLNSWQQHLTSARNRHKVLTVLTGTLLLVLGFQAFIWSLKKIVASTSYNLIQYNFGLAPLLIYFSLFLAGLSFIFFPLLILRRIFSTGWPGTTFRAVGLASVLLLGWLAELVFRQAGWGSLQAVLFLLMLYCLAVLVKRQAAYLVLSLFLMALVQFTFARNFTANKTRQLTQDILVHLVSSQKTWAEMALKQSLLELQREIRDIDSFFHYPADQDFARSLWNKTYLARLNWNSCLYLQSNDRKVLSSFALNMPIFADQTDDLEVSVEPVYTEQYLEILGQERHFLIGYQDFPVETEISGRLVIWVSLDPTLLPFINTANPYFELLRLNTLPSLQHFPVSLAIFDTEGQPLFHQSQPAFSLAPELRQKIKGQPTGLWTLLNINGKNYQAYCLTLDNDHFYAFYQPSESSRQLITGFLKLFFLFMIFSFLLFIPLAARRKEWRPDLHSFSARVYLAFFTVAIVPLFFFIFFTQAMVERIFADRFVNEATSRAYFARSILYDFTSLPESAEQQPAELPEDLVFWISSTINNDVNLYRKGVFVSSSRREFFETGILSDLIDGEVYSRIIFGHQPLAVSRKSFGQFSYQTLTIPYKYQQEIYLLSLPFPFERQEISQATGELLEFFIFSSIFFIGLIAFFATTIKRMIIVPINKLIRATQEVSLGNLDVKVDHQAQDELKSLIDGFNSMVENLQAHEKELAELSQKVAWAEMARRVAHEIKNPLTPIQLSAEHILKVHEDQHPEFDRILKESISYIISEVENLRRIAQEFMTIARESDSHREKFDLVELVEELLEPYRSTLEGRIRIILKKSGEDFRLNADREKIKVAIRNLLINSIEAIKGKGQIEFTLEAEPEVIRLEIKDNGNGIPADILERVFDPYFSTKEKGTGLGLAICKRIVEENGGAIKIESQPGLGTKVRLTFPRVADHQPG